jgi:CRISPR-associated endonuclease/helicase Cas3
LYETTKSGFYDSLSRLRPFTRHQEVEQEFYKRFTGVEVLPACFEEEYENYIHRLNFIEAERMVVPLHQGTFWKLFNKGLMEKSAAIANRKGRFRGIHYWLARCEYTDRLGLLDTGMPNNSSFIV